MGGDGKVLSQGSVSDVLKGNKALVEELKHDEEMIKKSEEEIDPEADKPADSPDGKLIVAEEVEEGHVSWKARESQHFTCLR